MSGKSKPRRIAILAVPGVSASALAQIARARAWVDAITGIPADNSPKAEEAVGPAQPQPDPKDHG